MIQRKLSTAIAVMAAALLAGGVVPGWVSAASAQQPDSGASGDDSGQGSTKQDTTKKVLSVIQAANTAFGDKEYERAFKKYKQAYDLYPDPAILVRLGKTSQALGDPAVAIKYYRRFIHLMPDDPTSDELKAEIATLQQQVPVAVTVESKPGGAAVFVDDNRDTSAGTSPVELELTPGKHDLRLERDGFAPATKTVEVSAGAPKSVAVSMERAGRPVADTQAMSGATNQDEGRLDVYGWSAAGVGVAALATSGIMAVLKSQAEDNFNNYDRRADGATRQELRDYKDNANSYYNTSLVTGIAGGVLAVTGATLLTYHYAADDGDDLAVGVDAHLGVDQATVGFNASF